MSLNIFELSQGNKPCSIFNNHLYVYVCGRVCFICHVLVQTDTVQYKLTNTDLRIMYPQCSNLNLSHGFCDVGQ